MTITNRASRQQRSVSNDTPAENPATAGAEGGDKVETKLTPAEVVERVDHVVKEKGVSIRDASKDVAKECGRRRKPFAEPFRKPFA